MLFLAAAKQELGSLTGEVVGVGPVVAAATAARILAQKRPDSVVLVGTAGAYIGGPKVGQAIVSNRIGLSYGVAAMGLGYVPRAPSPLAADPILLSQLSHLEAHDVLTTGAVTTDPTLCARISDGYTVEHLEAYAVAWACHDLNIPFVAVLGIANVVGPTAHTEWLTNRDSAQCAARDAIASLL